jgi:outer membrane protein OmpA-like peptidoglycan-associated protein
MKNLKIIIILLFVIFQTGFAQVATTTNAVTAPISNNGLQFSVRAGWDKPLFKNNAPYVEYKSGPEFGTSLDYYWNWFGLGFDFDYLNNGTKSTYPTDNLFSPTGAALTSFTIREDKITRMFYGVGPDFRYLSNSRKFQAELNTRFGLSSINGGKVEVRETTTGGNQLLNFHAGYGLNHSMAAKAQLRLTYFVTNNFGLHAGAYYIKHFDGTELVDPVTGIATGYLPFSSTLQSNQNMVSSKLMSRTEPCNCDLASVGVFAGLTYRFEPSVKVPVCKEEKPVVKKPEPCCGICPIYGLAVTARDKYTREVLPDTDIALKNSKGEIVKTGRTNSFGVYVFEKILKDDYTVSGLLNKVALIDTNVKRDELICDQVLQKEVLYGDRNFIIKGRAFECNTTTPIAGINVTLENKEMAFKSSTMTDDQGNFLLQLPETGSYDLYGRKESYFSQIEKVSGGDYNRDKNLFVKLQMCAEKVDCGKGLGLKNILFDLDKYAIKEVAKTELNRLVRFMQDNPTVKVEVGSHTDCRSSFKYNETLSQNRANASVDYVVSQGIDRSRISGKGYGESKLLNECADGVKCTEDQHSINRRTEMKVICPPKN